MAKEFVIKHGLIVHGEITGSDVRIDDWNSVSASLAELNSNVSETVTTASVVGNVITFTKSDGTTFDTVVQEDTGSFFTSASVDLNTITFHYGDNTSGSLSVETGTTLIRVKNTSGGAIEKGTPVYITGNVGATDMLQIAPADASDASKMPAVGLLLADLGINGEGFVVQGGYLTGMTTDVIDGTSTTSNDTVYVKAGGGLTMTKPTGDTNYIQNIAKVARVHGTAGSLVVSSILRTNDVPNLPTGKIWVGDGNTVTSSFVHLDETNQRMGIGTDTPLKPLHIDNESVPIRLESDTHNAVVVNYRTDEVGTGNGIQVGARGKSDFFVQQDIVTGGQSQWNVNVYVSQSGKVYLPNLDGGLDDLILYYNNETGELKPGAQPSTGSFFTSASVDLNTITFHYGDNTSGSITVDTGSDFISNIELANSVSGSSLIFTGVGGAFNGAVDMSKAYQQGGGMTLNYSGSVRFNAASDWVSGNPNRVVSTTATSMRQGGYNEWRFSDINRNFSSQYHSATNESLFDLISNVVNHTGQMIVRIYDDRNSAYEAFYMNSGSATIQNTSAGAGDLSLYLKFIGGRGFGVLNNVPGTNTLHNTNVAFSFTGTEIYESGSQAFSAFTQAAVDTNVLTLTRDDGSTEVLTIDTGSAVTTDISALNTFTGSIQTEVDNLKAATGSYYVSSSVDLNRITFTQGDGSTEVVTVHTGSKATPDTPLNTFQFNSSGEFAGSTLYFDDTNKQVGVNIDVPRATLHVRGANNTTGSLLIETDSVGGAESGFAKLDFRVADNDGNGYKKFAIIAENEGGGSNEANYGLGQLHFALNNDLNFNNARIVDSKLTLDHEGNIYMPDIDTGTTSNVIYYNTTTGEVTYGAAPSGGGTVNTGSFYVSSSVDLNRITFTQGDGTTEVVTVHTGSQATPAGTTTELQFRENGAFGATTGITYNSSPQRLELDTTSILIEGKSVPIQLTEGSTSSKQTVISYAQSTTSNVGFRVGNNDLGNTGRDIFVIAHGTTDWAASNTTNIFELDQAGSLIMSAYGAGNITGTPGYYLAVDATGRIVEELITTGSGGGTVDTGSLLTTGSVSNNVLTFTKGDGTTFDLTVDTGSAGGGSGTVNSGNAGYLAYYPSNGTTVDDQTGLYWDEASGELGIGTTNPARPLHIDSTNAVPIRLSSTTENVQLIQYYGVNSRGAGVRVGTQGENDFIVQQSDYLANTINTNLYVSESGETYLPRLGTSTTSDVVYYDSTTGELTYGSAPSGGTDTTIYSTNGTLSGNRTLTGGGNSLTFSGLSSVDLNADATQLRGQIYIAESSNSQVFITNATKSDVLYYDSTTGEVTYGTAPGGGSGTPGGSDSHVQFNNNGSFGGESDLRWDSSAARLGIKVPSADTVEAALHIAGTGIPIQFSGATQAFIRARTQSSTDQGVRFGLDFGANDRWIIERHNGSSWINNFYVENDGDTTVGGSLMVGSNNTSATLGQIHVNGSLGTGQISIYAANNIQAAGNLYASSRAHIGQATSPTSGKLQVTGNVSGVSIYASHDIVAYSDARSKVNVETIPNALEKVNAVRGVTYNKVEDPEGIRYMGVIAQELLEHLPEVVHQGEEGNYSVAYGNVVGVLIEAVKELTAKVEDLESRLGK